MFVNECNPIKWGAGEESISLGPVKTQSSSKSLKSPERTIGNKPKTKLASNSCISNFRQTHSEQAHATQRSKSNHPRACEVFHFIPQL